ncbi:hypothetical protein JCGZ_14408 [Jatropha curcas]|uniref:Uncharacterized protein n=1 Tax=Jatropha curcas TaxID=180498 RepID=A0A067JXL6_JATCU|nr:uncharacterized protein LOC105642993 [Jatropha curcas]KDP28637.1 hypothetical protein JCGZ_14408 [Jatropha curcas]
MALNNPPQKTLETAVDTTRGTEGQPESVSEEEEVEAEELERLESEAKEMAKKILEYRSTFPNQLEVTLASVLSAQRPFLPSMDSGSDLGPAGEFNPGLEEQVNSSKPTSLTEGDQKITEKVRLLKDKISSNVSAMPTVLNRMKECMSKIDNLDSHVGTLHPFSKKKKTS